MTTEEPEKEMETADVRPRTTFSVFDKERNVNMILDLAFVIAYGRDNNFILLKNGDMLIVKTLDWDRFHTAWMFAGS